MCRPEVVDRCYSSFSKCLRGISLRKCTLFLNIDPLPDVRRRNEVIEVAKQYFGMVVPNCPSEANFPRAVRWCWSQAQTEFLFHLEDDWELLRRIRVDRLLKLMASNKELQQIALRAYRRYRWHCLSPSLLRNQFYTDAAKNMVDTLNPETQLHRIYGAQRRRVFGYPRKIVLRDIGRDYLKTQQFIKPRVKREFVAWTEKNSTP
jgi:hypothetical protein